MPCMRPATMHVDAPGQHFLHPRPQPQLAVHPCLDEHAPAPLTSLPALLPVEICGQPVHDHIEGVVEGKVVHHYGPHSRTAQHGPPGGGRRAPLGVRGLLLGGHSLSRSQGHDRLPGRQRNGVQHRRDVFVVSESDSSLYDMAHLHKAGSSCFPGAI